MVFMATTLTYTVPSQRCSHLEAAVKEQLRDVVCVRDVDVDLVRKTVAARGVELEDAALRSAIGEAGYEAT